MAVKLHYSNKKYRIYNSGSIRNWLLDVIVAEGCKVDRIDYYFLDKNSLLEINKEFLEHDYDTDVITFDYSYEGLIAGEIYIGFDTVRENAIVYKSSIKDEIHRVMVHGLLHILGYGDSTDGEKREMREKEKFYLARRRI